MPLFCRVAQPDPLGLEAGISRYAYVLNDPLQKVDSKGMYVNPTESLTAQNHLKYSVSASTVAPSEIDVAMCRPANDNAEAVRVAELSYSDTVLGHADRPYISTLLALEIIGTGTGVPDPGGTGGLRFDVPGTFNGSSGVFQLVVAPGDRIVHLQFGH